MQGIYKIIRNSGNYFKNKTGCIKKVKRRFLISRMKYLIHLSEFFVVPQNNSGPFPKGK